MSRGNRVVASGNILTSMRDNYAELGVDEYYKKVGATYRNPHYPGVRQCLFSWFTTWWQKEHLFLGSGGPVIFDMACGSGEVTLALQEWWQRALLAAQGPRMSCGPPVDRPVFARRNAPPPILPGLGPTTPRPKIMAADPYTKEAFENRVALPCASLSFHQIAEGALPGVTSRLPLPEPHLQPSPEEAAPDAHGGINKTIDMVVCSFALHLIETPSELFALLWELSTKCRWLVILAPHKKPEIKDGWGWEKWDVAAWTNCRMSDSHGEFLFDR